MKWSASRLHFAHLMHDFVIEGNTQSAVQGNSWQDGVNALVMLQKAIQLMHELLSRKVQCWKYALFKELLEC